MTVDTALVVCPACRAINRIQQGREAQATCGKCQRPVFENHPLELVEVPLIGTLPKPEFPCWWISIHLHAAPA